MKQFTDSSRLKEKHDFYFLLQKYLYGARKAGRARIYFFCDKLKTWDINQSTIKRRLYILEKKYFSSLRYAL